MSAAQKRVDEMRRRPFKEAFWQSFAYVVLVVLAWQHASLGAPLLLVGYIACAYLDAWRIRSVERS